MASTVRRLFFTAVLVALVSGGCGAGRAKSPSTPTPLDVPSPPPRIIVPPEPRMPPSTPPQTPVTDAGTKPPKPVVRPAAPKTDAKAEPPATVELPVTVAPPPATLEQKLPTSVADSKKQVQDQIDRADAALGRIKVGMLSADQKAQFDTATQFIAQARQALSEGNLVFAAKVAEKAVALAAGLVR